MFSLVLLLITPPFLLLTALQNRKVEPTVILPGWTCDGNTQVNSDELERVLLAFIGRIWWLPSLSIRGDVRPSFSLAWKGSRYNQQSITMEDSPGASLLSENHEMKGMTCDGLAFHLDDVFQALAINEHSAVFQESSLYVFLFCLLWMELN